MSYFSQQPQELGRGTGGRSILEVRDTLAKGRGVFACVRFARGEIIEIVPVIVIPEEQRSHIESTVLARYIYHFGPEWVHAAIALGYGSLYNHSYSPNAEFVRSWEERVIRFVALRDIEAGEEILINYNGSPEDRSPLEFEVKE